MFVPVDGSLEIKNYLKDTVNQNCMHQACIILDKHGSRK
jgi:hypothetical protein